ncbi:MAG: CPBP family intramembrane metalloprotease [Actinobacteria bacterium]|nr:CPBP family intramembrane metalloprotease [Actinomycetota bacterium]
MYLVGLVIGAIVVAPLVAGRAVEAANGGSTGLGIAASMLSELVTTGVLVLWLRARHPHWRQSIRFPSRDRVAREAGVGVLAGLALYPAIAFGVGVVLTIVFRGLLGRDVQAPEQLSNSLGAGAATLAAVYAIGVAPFAEELFFRGVLFRSIRDRRGFWPGAIVSALAFGLVHYVPAPWQDAVLLQTIMVFTGLGLAFVYERRGNLVANWAAHAMFNVIGIALVLMR